MELKLNIGYEELVELVKQLPSKQLAMLKAELSIFRPDKKEGKKKSLQKFLLEGPVMTDAQYEQFLSNRIYIGTWRKDGFV